jgi:hypothetical protein
MQPPSQPTPADLAPRTNRTARTIVLVPLAVVATTEMITTVEASANTVKNQD